MSGESHGQEDLLRLARKKMRDFDTIIDLYDMTFVYMTRESARVSGHTPREMIGKPIADFMTIPRRDQSFTKTIMKSMEGGVVRIPVRTKDGKEKVVEMKHAVVELEGYPYLVTRAVPKKKPAKKPG